MVSVLSHVTSVGEGRYLLTLIDKAGISKTLWFYSAPEAVAVPIRSLGSVKFVRTLERDDMGRPVYREV